MEAFIDDLASDERVSDIQSETMQIGNANNGSNGVKMPGASMRPSDVRVYHNTLLGYIMVDVLGMPLREMKEGVHYVQVDTIPYKTTPKGFFPGEKQEKSPTGASSKRAYKQAPLRVKH